MRFAQRIASCEDSVEHLQQGVLGERRHVDHDVRLYLWESKDGRPIGLYARAWCRRSDPQFYVHVPLKGLSCEVWTVDAYGTRLWPAEDSPIKVKSPLLASQNIGSTLTLPF